jgi:uncharacterized membrane protein (UPF0127 family)
MCALCGFVLLACVACGRAAPTPTPTVVPAVTATPIIPASPTSKAKTIAIRKHDGSAVMLVVEVADTPESQAAGLSGRSSLAPDAGMLFDFPSVEPIEFWMHDTLIPLSIAFVDDNRKITAIQDMQPLTDDHHVPPGPIRYAIEANLGFFSRAGVAVGDSIDLGSIALFLTATP